MFFPVTEEASHIITLWWILFTISLFVFLVVTSFLLVSLKNKSPEKDKKLLKPILGIVGVTTIILVGTIILSYRLSPHQGGLKDEESFMVIEVTGLRWWWQVRYFDQGENLLFETANEIVLPVNRKVTFRLVSEDVIHSFWVPRLAGKQDMIPGHTNEFAVKAREIGEYRGQCAEFCGIQHAKMSFLVEVVTFDEYDDWQSEQMRPATIVKSEAFTMGKKIFKQATCAECHNVRGVYQSEKAFGPDLTHFKSRRMLAAASVPNNTGYLAAWIADPQSIKPGNLMPATRLNSEEFNLLLIFLESLN